MVNKKKYDSLQQKRNKRENKVMKGVGRLSIMYTMAKSQKKVPIVTIPDLEPTLQAKIVLS